MLVAFEGPNGSGKTTVINSLKQFWPELIYLKEDVDEWHSPTDRLLKIMAYRSELVNSVISPSLKKGKTVIMDRFYMSTIAYNGYAEFKPHSDKPSEDLYEHLGFIQRLSDMVCAGIEPDLNIYIDVPLSTVIRRRPSMSVTFAQKVMLGYQQVIKSRMGKVVAVDGRQSKEDLFLQVVKVLLMEDCIKMVGS